MSYTPDKTLKEIAEACLKTETVYELRKVFTSYKHVMDRLNTFDRDKSREIYWDNKRRINGEI